MAIAGRHGLVVIEDACEALGAEVDGRPVGAIGACGVFGFYPNKQITTGEGGMIVTDRAPLAADCRSMRNHGRDPGLDSMEHVRLGYNYRLSELACALGLSQLERLDALLAGRCRVAHRYHRRLAEQADVTPPAIDVPGTRLSWFVYVVKLAPEFRREDRDWIAIEMRRRGIGCARYFGAAHLHAHVRQACGHQHGAFPHAEAAADRTLALPFFARITDGELDEVCDTLLALVRAVSGRA
jgi:perosamine synthetase